MHLSLINSEFVNNILIHECVEIWMEKLTIVMMQWAAKMVQTQVEVSTLLSSCLMFFSSWPLTKFSGPLFNLNMSYKFQSQLRPLARASQRCSSVSCCPAPFPLADWDSEKGSDFPGSSAAQCQSLNWSPLLLNPGPHQLFPIVKVLWVSIENSKKKSGTSISIQK